MENVAENELNFLPLIYDIIKRYIRCYKLKIRPIPFSNISHLFPAKSCADPEVSTWKRTDI